MFTNGLSMHRENLLNGISAVFVVEGPSKVIRFSAVSDLQLTRERGAWMRPMTDAGDIPVAFPFETAPSTTILMTCPNTQV